MALRRHLVAPSIVAMACATTLSFACGGSGSGDGGGVSGGAVTPLPEGDPSRSDSGGANGDGATGILPDGGRADAIAPSQDAGGPAIRFIGRFDTRDPAGPTCAWPGCRIIANFSGSEVKVRFDERVETWMQGGPSEWDVAIDGVLQPKLVLQLGARDYVLASGLPAGAHRVELYKRSEAQNGYTQFLGYDFGGGALLPPPLAATRRIEFVGDSGPAGFGIEGVGQGPDCPGPDWAAQWQNFHKAMPARLGEIVSADVHGTIYSGKGLVKNIYRSDPDTLPVIYSRANPILSNSPFDLSSYVPDVFVVMLGGNDFALGQPVDDGAASLADFTAATRALVGVFRTRAPQAHVLLALSPSVTDTEPPGRDSRTNVKAAFDAVAAERAAQGDARVYSVAPPLAAASELTGCNGHGTPQYHDRVAQQLAVVVKEKAGW